MVFNNNVISDTDDMQITVAIVQGEHRNTYMEKILNKGCCLERMNTILNNMILEVKGSGKLTFRTTNNKNYPLGGFKVFKNSGFYDLVYNSNSKKGAKLCCRVKDSSGQLPIAQIQDGYTGKIKKEFRWKTGKEKFRCKLKRKNQDILYIDLGNETEKKRNVVYVEK